jgi:hypothetical protein
MTDAKPLKENKIIKKTSLTAKERANILNKKESFNYDAFGLDKNNFHYHWTNIDGALGSNVETYEKVGYDLCKDKQGNPITKKGQVTGVSQYLMRIPIDMYEAIQKEKIKEVNEIERSLGKKNIKDLPESDIYGDVRSTAEVIVR